MVGLPALDGDRRAGCPSVFDRDHDDLTVMLQVEVHDHEPWLWADEKAELGPVAERLDLGTEPRESLESLRTPFDPAPRVRR
jgi:hypothetical protein